MPELSQVSVVSVVSEASAVPEIREAHAIPMPRPDGCPFAEPERFRDLRAGAPISRARLWDGSEAWLVSRYQDLRTLINDPRLSVEPRRAGYPLVSPAQKAVLDSASSFVFKDDPEHNRLRGAVTPELTGKRIEAALARRIPTLRIAVPLGEVPFRHDMAIYGAHALPVEW